MGRFARNLKETVTVWPTSGGLYDGCTFGTPATQRARWEQKAVDFRTPNGEEEVSESVVWVLNDIDIGDYIALGDQTSIADPSTLVDARRVRQFSKIPDLRNVDIERRAFL